MIVRIKRDMDEVEINVACVGKKNHQERAMLTSHNITYGILLSKKQNRPLFLPTYPVANTFIHSASSKCLKSFQHML